MKNEKQIREALEDARTAQEEYDNLPDHDDNQYIYQGWVEALEFVLADAVVDPELEKVFNKIADQIAREDYWAGTNGLFSYADEIEEGEVEDDMGEELEGWHATIHYGVQSDVEDTTHRIRIGMTKTEYERWKANPDGVPKCKEFYY